jgi:hypothetical protein
MATNSPSENQLVTIDEIVATTGGLADSRAPIRRETDSGMVGWAPGGDTQRRS